MQKMERNSLNPKQRSHRQIPIHASANDSHVCEAGTLQTGSVDLCKANTDSEQI
jgi:hypothetical protein